jgi:hypothetical protein
LGRAWSGAVNLIFSGFLVEIINKMSGVIPSSRVFIGKVGALPRAELNKECAKHGEILDFLMKDQYAFVVTYPKIQKF